MLKFDDEWRYESPGKIPDGFQDEITGVISKIARGDQDVLETFKNKFAYAVGQSTSQSSSASWAETDLHRYMDSASLNAPMFIEAFFDGCEAVRKEYKERSVPDMKFINRLLVKHGSNYRIDETNLLYTGATQPVTIPEIPASLEEKAKKIIDQSLETSMIFLAEGKGRQAVQELLWLLETVTTAFQGMSNGNNDTIGGKYFNKIIEELKKANAGTTLEQVTKWITQLHGYLSAPSGGGVRHGMHLRDGIIMSLTEAKMYCNLINTYMK